MSFITYWHEQILKAPSFIAQVEFINWELVCRNPSAFHLVILKHANTALVVQSFVLTKKKEEEECSGGMSYTE